MTFLMVAFSQSYAATGIYQPVDGIQDPQLNVQGKDIRVLRDAANIIGWDVLEEKSGASNHRITAPSLNIMWPVNIPRYTAGAKLSDKYTTELHPGSPIQMVGDESINFEAEGVAAQAGRTTAFIFMSTGPISPAQTQSRPYRYTYSVTGVDTKWTDVNLTPTTPIPYGNYAVVGMREVSALAKAVRLIFPNQVHRPGCMSLTNPSDEQHPAFRRGGLGVWGTFDSNVPPRLDVFGAGAHTGEVYLDLVKL